MCDHKIKIFDETLTLTLDASPIPKIFLKLLNRMFQYIFTYFPISQFSILLGVSLIPIILSTFLIAEFYSIIIGDGSVYEADWVPVSIGFAIACAVGLYKVPYNLYIGKQLLASSSNNATQSTSDDETISESCQEYSSECSEL